MQGPDYTQWHGAYEIMHDLSELREMADDILEENGLEPLDLSRIDAQIILSSSG